MTPPTQTNAALPGADDFDIFQDKQHVSFGRTDPGYEPSERCCVWDNRGMSPKSRGRPPGRGRSRRPASGRRPAGKPQRAGSISGWVAEEDTDCWFDEPLPGDRRSWAVPPGHGSYQDLDLERLDPGRRGRAHVPARGTAP